jgi:hypothetical protein
MEGLKHDRYMRAHGKKAKGTATWMFTTKKDGEVNYDNDKEVFQSGPSMKLADAAKKAMDALKSKTIYVMEAKLDPVGKEDDDVDNDGDVDKSDKYLKKRRAAIKKAINTKPAMKEAAKKQKAKLLPVKGSVDDANDVAQKATGESVNEAATPQMMKAAKELEMYAKKHGGIDKTDFMKASKMLASGKAGTNLVKFVDGLDTDPREKVITVMGTHMGNKTVGKMFGVNIREEVELDEDRRTELSHQSMMFTHAMKQAEFKKKDPRLAKQHDMAGKLHAKAADMHADNHPDAKKHSDKANKASKLLGEEVELDETLSPSEKKLVNQMYDKKGNLTPLGKKVMNHGKKPGDNIREETEQLDESTQMMENLADAIDNTDLAKLTVEELSEIEEGIIKALGVAAKKTVGGVAKGVGAVAKGVGKAAKSAVINKQGNIRGTQAAKTDAQTNKANKIADKLQRNKDAADRLKAAQDRIKSLSSKPKKPLAASYNEDLNEIGSNFETKPNEKKLADLGRKMMDMGQKEKNDTLSNAYARLGDALTRYGTTFGARNIKDLEKKTGMKQAIIMDLMKRAAKHK